MQLVDRKNLSIPAADDGEEEARDDWLKARRGTLEQTFTEILFWAVPYFCLPQIPVFPQRLPSVHFLPSRLSSNLYNTRLECRHQQEESTRSLELPVSWALEPLALPSSSSSTPSIRLQNVL